MANHLVHDISVDEAEIFFTDILATIKESELVALLANGDKAGMVMLYEKYAPVLYYKICVAISETPLAEEALEKTFITIWENFSSFNKNEDRLYPWMVNIALSHASAIKSAYDPTLRERDGVSLNQGNALSIVELLHFGGYTKKEIVQAFSIPTEAVHEHLRTAMNKLRK